MSAALAFTTVAGSPALASEPLADGCSGGRFCAWDGRDFTGDMIVNYSAVCSPHDIGLAGRGDRVTSYWNSTGKTITLYNWTGQRWQLLATIRDGERGNLRTWADNKTDSVNVCFV